MDRPQPDGAGGGSATAGEFKADDPKINKAAEAADLVLKRLKQNLERGEVDQELLNKLGWTEDQLKAFSKRMPQKLDILKDPEADQLQKRRVEELLKSLDLSNDAEDRVGRNGRDKQQQDTTTRRSTPPAKYKDWQKLYEQSLSEGQQRRKP